jgi:pilus assembly protein CpaB
MNNDSRSLWLSLAAGIFASFLLYSYSQEKKAEYDKKNGTMKTVLVAKVDIAEMQTIDDSLVMLEERPSNFIEPSPVYDIDSAIGQVAATPIKKGEQILTTKLLQPGPDTGISLQVAPSKRAVTIPIDEVRGIAKLIRPGDRVDIVAAIDSGKGATQKREVIGLMDDVVVLATGINVVNNIPRTFELESGGKNINQISLAGSTSYTSITIEASPKEAQDLIYILSTSAQNLYFTLRNPNDRKVQPRLPASTSDSILGRTPSYESSATSPQSFTQPALQNSAPSQRPSAPPTSLPAKKPNYRSL